MESDFKELEALIAALNRSAERVQTLWFSFLTVTLYLAITTGTTTHRMLLLEEGLPLPLLNLKLSLLGFYILAPAIFAVFHAYFLMMLVLLARTAKTFEDALEATMPRDQMTGANERFRMRVENAIFLQVLIGARRERAGPNARVLRTIALLSLAVAPVFLMLMFQLMFLPYHGGWITWWHRILLTVDVMLVWTLWPAYLREWGERLRPRWTFSWRAGVQMLASIYVLLFSFAVATYPGEPRWAHWLIGRYHNAAVHLLRAVSLQPRFHGKERIFWNRLELAHENLVDHEKLNRLIAENTYGGTQRPVFALSLSGRDLAAGHFDFADLRQVDFRGVNLKGASFNGAWLQNSDFEGVDADHAWFQAARLDGASFASTSVARTKLSEANFGGATAYGADFSGAKLENAQLFGDLRGADFRDADLRTAVFEGARLQGADFSRARLSGADLRSSQLQGAVFYETDFQAAELSFAAVWRTRGRPLFNGTMPNAYYMKGTETFGEWLRRTQPVCVGVAPPFDSKDGETGEEEEGRYRKWLHQPRPNCIDYTPRFDTEGTETFTQWLQGVVAGLREPVRAKVIRRLSVLDPNKPSLEDMTPAQFRRGRTVKHP